MNNYSPGDSPKHTPDQPWWNDKDKIGGAAATITVLIILIVVAILAIAVALKIASWII